MIFKPSCVFFFVAVIVAFGLFPFRHAVAQTPNLTVTVAGAGPSYDEARTDAVRKALQLSFKQLVVVDRIVSEDDVLRDRVLSTSNGYVEAYRERKVNRRDDGVYIEADVTVSASRIENFLGVVAGGGGAVNGSLLGKEIQRRKAQDLAEKAQKQARGEILDRLFEAFPWGALQFDLKRIDFKKYPAWMKMKDNTGLLVLRLTQTYKPTFLASLRDTLRALSIHECSSQFISSHNPLSFDIGEIQSACLAEYRKKDEKEAAGVFCVGVHTKQHNVTCFILDEGTYFSRTNDHYFGVQSALIGKFADAQFASASKQVILNMPSIYDNFGAFSVQYETRFIPFTATIWAGEREFEIEIPSAQVNLDHATHFIVVPAYLDDGKAVGLTSHKAQAMPAADILKEAERQYRLSRQ